MKQFVITISCVFSFFSGFAQDQEAFKSLISSVKEVYDTQKAYELGILYNIYSAKDPTTIRESHKGDYIKNGSNIYSKIGTVEFVSVEDTFLQINHDEKAILYAKQAQENTLNPIQIEGFINHFESIQVQKKNNEWICKLSKPKDLEQFPYDAIEVYIDQNFQVRKQILFPIQSIVFKTKSGDSTLDRSIVHIEFSNVQPFKRKELLQLSTYIQTQNAIITPSESIKEYQLIKA